MRGSVAHCGCLPSLVGVARAAWRDKGRCRGAGRCWERARRAGVTGFHELGTVNFLARCIVQ
jgi:hypothetical protein